MNVDTFLEQFGHLADAPEGIKKLRELILDLAVRGKLAEQDLEDEPAKNVLEQINKLKKDALKKKEIQKDKPLSVLLNNHQERGIPSLWEWVRLQDIFEITRGGSPRPSGDPRYFGGDIPWVTVREITKDNGKFLYETKDGITQEGTKKSRFINKGDLLLTNSGATLGVPKISCIRACINDGVALLNCFHTLINKEYAYYFLSSQTNNFRRINQGLAQPNLNTSIIASWHFPFPPLAEQKRIVAKVDELMALCDELETQQQQRQTVHAQLTTASLHQLTTAETPRQLTKAWQRIDTQFDQLFTTRESIEKLRQTILQLAVQGKLVPQDPEDEPAEKLLERIEDKRVSLVKQKSIANFISKGHREAYSGNVNIPKSWAWSSLGALISIMDSGWSPKCLDQPSQSENTWGILKTTSVQKMSFAEIQNKELPENLKPRPKHEVREGDLLITRAGPKNRVGISCVVPQVRPLLMISDKIIRFHLLS